MTPKFPVESRVYFVIPGRVRGAATIAEYRMKKGQIEYRVRLGSRENIFEPWIPQKYVYDPAEARKIAQACLLPV